jgi:hypothetical protein
MPIIPIVAAGAAFALGGGAAIGAVIAGTATLATTLTAVATVGATLGAIGAITKDKTLSTIGTVMGAVGGVGALAANAGLFGAEATTASLFGSDPIPLSVAGPDIAADVASTNDLSSLANLPGLPADMSVSADALTATGDLAAPTAALDTATAAASGEADSLINGSGGIPGMKTLVGQNVDDATNQLVKGSGGGSLPSGSPTDAASIAKAGAPSPGDVTPPPMTGGAMPDVKIPGQTYQGQDGVTYVSDGTKWTAQTGFFGSLLKSPMAQYGVIQAAGSFLSGAFDPLKPAQVEALNAQATANKASAAFTTQQTQNMTGRLPIASRVTGTPAPIMGGSMINNAPVTGTVAA